MDVKDIQNTPQGVPGFWMRVMLNSAVVGKMIQEKDRPILMHLQDVASVLHEKGFGFDLTFTFEKNDYFSNEVLKKSFVMSRDNVIERCEGTEISWKDGKDVTKKKVKKKSKKKGAKAVTKTVEQESFFNFFKTIEMPDEKKLESKEEAEDEKDAGTLMDEDFDVGKEFLDQVIPLALEYYLEVIEEDDEDEEDECCSDDGHHHNHGKGGKGGNDSDDDQPKKGKKGGDKKGGAAGAAG